MAGSAIGEEDPYEVLGVPRDAAAEELRKAYYALALRWHPDKQGPDERTVAERNFKAIGGAYGILSDAGRRKAFDRAASVSGFRKKRPGSAGVRRPCSAGPGARRGSRPQSARPEEDAGSAPRPPRPGPSWERCSAPVLERPPHSRVWFARASAAVGRAYKGLEGEEMARCRQQALEDVAHWVSRRPGAVILDVRGCADKGEVSRQQLAALGKSRGEKALRFLVDKCLVPEEQCRASSVVGEDFQGVELRALFRMEAEGSFFERLEGLCNEEPLDALAAAALRVPRAMILVEVFGAANAAGRLSQRRVAALRASLEERGVPRRRLSGRVREGAAEEARFYLYEEPVE